MSSYIFFKLRSLRPSAAGPYCTSGWIRLGAFGPNKFGVYTGLEALWRNSCYGRRDGVTETFPRTSLLDVLIILKVILPLLSSFSFVLAFVFLCLCLCLCRCVCLYPWTGFSCVYALSLFLFFFLCPYFWTWCQYDYHCGVLPIGSRLPQTNPHLKTWQIFARKGQFCKSMMWSV